MKTFKNKLLKKSSAILMSMLILGKPASFAMKGGSINSAHKKSFDILKYSDSDAKTLSETLTEKLSNNADDSKDKIVSFAYDYIDLLKNIEQLINKIDKIETDQLMNTKKESAAEQLEKSCAELIRYLYNKQIKYGDFSTLQLLYEQFNIHIDMYKNIKKAYDNYNEKLK